MAAESSAKHVLPRRRLNVLSVRQPVNRQFYKLSILSVILFSATFSRIVNPPVSHPSFQPPFLSATPPVSHPLINSPSYQSPLLSVTLPVSHSSCQPSLLSVIPHPESLLLVNIFSDTRPVSSHLVSFCVSQSAMGQSPNLVLTHSVTYPWCQSVVHSFNSISAIHHITQSWKLPIQSLILSVGHSVSHSSRHSSCKSSVKSVGQPPCP